MKKITEITHNIEYIYNNDIKLALHSWIPEQVHAVLFYIHGIQSHAGWSNEMANQLASSSIAVFILDRRGAGHSEGLRGDIPSSQELLTDYYLALIKVKNTYRNVPLTLLGHSQGGSILAGLLSWSGFKTNVQSIIFCASALGKLHQNLSIIDQEKILNNRSVELYDLELDDKDYTDDPYYLNYIKNDKLICRKITHRSRAAILEIEKLYWKKIGITNNAPSIYIHPQIDPLVNINKSLDVFRELTNQQGVVLQIPANKHYLWFTNQRHIVTNWLINYILTEGYQHYGNSDFVSS